MPHDPTRIDPALDPQGRSEAEFLASYDPGAFERPSVAADVVILTVDQGQLRVALYERSAHPAIGRFALPGGFIDVGEVPEEAARRHMALKTGLRDVFIEQLYTFGAPGRDPRGHIISVTFVALVDARRFTLVERRVGARGGWVHVPWPGEAGGPVEVRGSDGRVLPLAFDHADIIGLAVKRLRGKLGYTPIGFQLLPPAFTLRQLQAVHETVLSTTLNKDSFRRRMLATGHLEATGERERDVEHRPAELYRFVRRSAV